MRSDELIDRVRKAADIGSVTSWPDFPDERILQELTERHCQLMGDEEIRARSGYGVQTLTFLGELGKNEYPVPARALGGAFEKLEVRGPGNRWHILVREDVSGSEVFDFVPGAAGTPQRYSVRDGFVALYPPPAAGLPLRFTFYIRPSQIVHSQSLTFGGDHEDRGRITAIDPVLRELTINAVPWDQLALVPAPLPLVVTQRLDIVRPSGTFALSMYSVQAKIFDPSPPTPPPRVQLLGTESMQRIQIGDYVRAEDQTDWPMGLPAEAHRMVANRAAMEVARDVGVEEKVAALKTVTDQDLARFRRARSPQVKGQPVIIPLRPMQSR